MPLIDRLRDLVVRQSFNPAVGLVRVLVALAALAELLQLVPAILRVSDPDILRAPVLPGLVEQSPIVLAVAGSVWAASGFAFLLGWKTRTAGILLVGAMVAVVLTEQQLYSNHLYLQLLICCLLVAADSGAHFSLDSRSGPPRKTPEWPLFLMRLQLSIVYVFAALSKVNDVYLSGVMVASTFRYNGAFSVPWVFASPLVAVPLSWMTIILEMYLALAIWSARSRPFVFVLGFGLHAAFLLMLNGAAGFAIFGVTMLALYLPFMDRPHAEVVVIWDDQCSFCRRSVTFFRYLDWSGVHRFVGSSEDEVMARYGITRSEADRALQVVAPGGSRHSAFAAVCVILERLPLSFLWAPLLRVPPLPTLGERAYAAVAARRHCALDVQPTRG